MARGFLNSRRQLFGECRHCGRGTGNSWPISKASSSQLIPAFWSGLNLLLLVCRWNSFVRQTLPNFRHL
jgi:hypothetical protein